MHDEYEKVLAHKHIMFYYKYEKQRHYEFHKDENKNKNSKNKIEKVKRKSDEEKIVYLDRCAEVYRIDKDRVSMHRLIDWAKEARNYIKVQKLERQMMRKA